MKFVHIKSGLQVSNRTTATAIAMSSISMPINRNSAFFLLSSIFIIKFNGGKYMEQVQKTSVPLFVRYGVNCIIYNFFLSALKRKEYYAIFNAYRNSTFQTNPLTFVYKKSECIRYSE